MITSMTGYGRGETRLDSTEIQVEIRSVNHRYCEVAVKIPRPLAPYEQDLKRLVQRRFARGRFDVTVSFGGGQPERTPLTWDKEYARNILRILQEMRVALDLDDPVTIAHVLQFREVVAPGMTRLDIEKILKGVVECCGSAMDELERMRRVEGRALSKDLRYRFKEVLGLVNKIEKRSPKITESYAVALRQRVQELLGSTPLDEGRLLQEIAIAAERCDVSEEIVRLKSHLGQCAEIEKSSQPSGRRLEFLLQEMNREVNTIGSKANDAMVANWVVASKAELEKIREQVQNIE